MDILFCELFFFIYDLKSSKKFFFSVPEIGENENDQLFTNGKHELPEFSKFTVEHCISTIGNQALAVEKGLSALESEIITKTEIQDVFKEVLNPLEDLTSQVESTWGLAKTLYLGNSTLMPTKSYLTIHDRMVRVRAAKFNSLPVYLALKQAQKNEKENFDEQQKRLMNKYLLEGKLNGVELDFRRKAQLSESLIKIANHRKNFHEKLQHARRLFTQNCNDPVIVKELPISLLQAISVDPKAPPTKGK